MTTAQAEQHQNHSTSQIIAALYSALFLAVIWFGYFLLFSKSIAAAVPLATILALTAWFLARFIGNHEGGIKRYWPMFALLLVLSAVGVFNSLMLNLEGRKIFAETISEASDDFTKLDAAAATKMRERGIGEHLGKVRELESALIREIQNPLNCGQGPVARQIIADLKRELPGFKELSSAGVDCSKNEAVVADYHSRIQDLVEDAPWNDAVLMQVRADSQTAKTSLQDLDTRAGTMFAPGLLTKILPEFPKLDTDYRTNYSRLVQRDVDVSQIPAQLHLSEVNSLGEWSQLIGLIIERLDRITTWLYLALAFCFDYLMVYFFTTVRKSRPLRGGQNLGRQDLPKAW